MSTTADDVLNAIDAALYDWSVSDDAMRWQPEEMREPETGGTFLQLASFDYSAMFDGYSPIPVPGWITVDMPLTWSWSSLALSSGWYSLTFDEAPQEPPRKAPPVPAWTVELWPSVTPAWPPAATVRLDDPEQRDAWHAETSPRAVVPVPGPGLPGALAAAGLAGDGLAHLWPADNWTKRRRQ